MDEGVASCTTTQFLGESTIMTQELPVNCHVLTVTVLTLEEFDTTKVLIPTKTFVPISMIDVTISTLQIMDIRSLSTTFICNCTISIAGREFAKLNSSVSLSICNCDS